MKWKPLESSIATPMQPCSWPGSCASATVPAAGAIAGAPEVLPSSASDQGVPLDTAMRAPVVTLDDIDSDVGGVWEVESLRASPAGAGDEEEETIAARSAIR